MGSYKITTAPNEIAVSFEGSFTPENAQSFVREFQQEASKVNPDTCHLILDGDKLAVSPKEMADMLRGVFSMYKQMGFNHISMNPGSNAILRMQVNRLAKEAGLTDFELR